MTPSVTPGTEPGALTPERKVRYDSIPAEPWEGNGPCTDCGARSPYWRASKFLWSRVMGDGTGEPPGLICPVCFTIRAWQKGVPGWDNEWSWTPTPPEYALREDFDWMIQARNAAADTLAAAEAALTAARERVEKLEAVVTAGRATVATDGDHYCYNHSAPPPPDCGCAGCALHAAIAALDEQ